MARPSLDEKPAPAVQVHAVHMVVSTRDAGLRQASYAELEGLKGLLKIDRNALDEALVEQADFFFRVSQACAISTSRRDQAKQLRDEEKAKSDHWLRGEIAAGREKLSETAVAQRVVIDPVVSLAVSNYLEWSQLTDLWTALKEAATMRSYALKDLSGLYAAGYWGTSMGSEPRSQARDRLAEQGREAMAEQRESYARTSRAV